MLPIKAWRIMYADGSSFTNGDGTWAEAPPFGVQCVVYYHIYNNKQLRTIDSGREGNDIYVWEGEGENEGWKMGMWMDTEGLHRIHDYAKKSVMPEPSQ